MASDAEITIIGVLVVIFACLAMAVMCCRMVSRKTLQPATIVQASIEHSAATPSQHTEPLAHPQQANVVPDRFAYRSTNAFRPEGGLAGRGSNSVAISSPSSQTADEDPPPSYESVMGLAARRPPN